VPHFEQKRLSSGRTVRHDGQVIIGSSRVGVTLSENAGSRDP